MAYEITNDHDTDLSPSRVRTTLANAAKRLTAARGQEVPTKTVFETPEILDEDDNRFEVSIRKTVTDAGFEPEELITNVNIRGVAIDLLGTVSGGDRDKVRVRVSKSSKNTDIESMVEMWEQIE